MVTDWRNVQFGDFFDIQGGTQPPRSEFITEPKEGYVRLIQIRDFESDEYAVYVQDKKSLKKCEEKDIFIARYGASIGRILRGLSGAYNVALAKVLIPDTFDRDFVYYFLNSSLFQDELAKVSARSAQSGFNKQDLASISIPFPSRNEQHIIAAILTSIDDVIAATQRIIDQTEVVKRGLMQQLLTKGIGHTTFKQTEIGEIPTEWDVVTIGDTCMIGTGGTPRRDDPENWNGAIPWVKTTEIKNGSITETEESITEHALQTSSVKMYPVGTVLLAMYGQGVTRGKSAVLGIDATTNQACAAMQPNSNLLNKLLFYVLQYNYENIRELGHGSNQANLNLNLVKSVQIPLPPIEEQRKICSIMETLDSKLDNERGTELALEKLKASLMQVLLTGKIRVNVDEPSEVSV